MRTHTCCCGTQLFGKAKLCQQCKPVTLFGPPVGTPSTPAQVDRVARARRLDALLRDLPRNTVARALPEGATR